MKLEELVKVTIAGMPMTINEETSIEPLCQVETLYYNGELLLPKQLLEREVMDISLDGDKGLYVIISSCENNDLISVSDKLPQEKEESNLSVIENVLGMSLSDEELEWIEQSWNDFYNNPARYQNTAVIEMVKQFVNKKNFNIIQSQYRRGVLTRNEALEEIRQILEHTTVQSFCELLLDNFKYD